MALIRECLVKDFFCVGTGCGYIDDFQAPNSQELGGMIAWPEKLRASSSISFILSVLTYIVFGTTLHNWSHVELCSSVHLKTNWE